MICRMDVFLVKLSLILGHIATAMLPLIMNNLIQKYIHSGLTFVIKHPLTYFVKRTARVAASESMEVQKPMVR